jgi:hypothetical protein
MYISAVEPCGEYNLEMKAWDLLKHGTIAGLRHQDVAVVPEKFFKHSTGRT